MLKKWWKILNTILYPASLGMLDPCTISCFEKAGLSVAVYFRTILHEKEEVGHCEIFRSILLIQMKTIYSFVETLHSDIPFLRKINTRQDVPSTLPLISSTKCIRHA